MCKKKERKKERKERKERKKVGMMGREGKSILFKRKFKLLYLVDDYS